MKKKKIFKIIFILGSISSLVFVPWILVKVWITPLPRSIPEQLNKSIDYGLNGTIVYIDQAGKPPQNFAAGWHNREEKIPANPNALFKIASISKLYVAVAVAKMVNNKQLALDKSLAAYLPQIGERIENASEITLQMLVQHRSGIPNFSDTPNYWENPTLNNQESLELIYDKPADFKPNETYRYSNTNYLLLGEILDKTLGYSHHLYIKQEILDPLDLKNTYSLLNDAPLEKVMSGYDTGYTTNLKELNFINPSGSMVATAADVGVFLRALNNGSLLNENEQAIYSKIYVYEHTGLLPGYSSIAKYDKAMDTVVIQFVNSSGGYTWSILEIINSRILKILRNNSKS